MACCAAKFIFEHKLIKDTADMHTSCREVGVLCTVKRKGSDHC